MGSLSLLALAAPAFAVEATNPNLPAGMTARDFPATADANVPVTGKYYLRLGGGTAPNIATRPFPESHEYVMVANEEGYPVPSGRAEPTDAQLRDEWLQMYMERNHKTRTEALAFWNTQDQYAVLSAYRQSRHARTVYRHGLTNAQKTCFNKQVMELRSFAAGFLMSQDHIRYLRSGHSIPREIDIDLMEQPGVNRSAQPVKIGARGQIVVIPATAPRCVPVSHAAIRAAVVAHINGQRPNAPSNVPSNQTGRPGTILATPENGNNAGHND